MRLQFGFLSPEREAETPSSCDPRVAVEAGAVCDAANQEEDAPQAFQLSHSVNAWPDYASDLKGIICLSIAIFRITFFLLRLDLTAYKCMPTHTGRHTRTYKHMVFFSSTFLESCFLFNPLCFEEWGWIFCTRPYAYVPFWIDCYCYDDDDNYYWYLHFPLGWVSGITEL